MKKHLKLGLFLLTYWIGIIAILAQGEIIEYEFEKGEVLDVLLLTNGPESEALFPRYLKTVFPVGAEFSFKPIPGLAIGQTLQGGVQPSLLIFGKWDSRKKRENFLEAIVPSVPDFHEQRRDIWSYFALTYYELKEHTQFSIDQSKYNVVTSYWGKGKAFQEYIALYEKALHTDESKEIITLTRGYSPPGYAYNPDYFTITQWESKEAFDRFYATHQAFTEKRIENVHQFVLK